MLPHQLGKWLYYLVARRLPLFFPFLGFGGPLLKLPVHLLHDIAKHRNPRGHQASDQQSLYSSLEDQAFLLVAKLWSRILRQLIMGNRNQSSELVQENNLARLVCRRDRFCVLNGRRL